MALVYAAVQIGLAHGTAAVGPLAFACGAGLGIVWARRSRGRLAGPWAGAVIALAVGGVGWLADPTARSALEGAIGGSGGWASFQLALATNTAGWLLGLAFVRGAAHRTRARDEERVGRLLGRILLLAIPWAIGIAFAQAARPAFVAQALVCTVLFAGCGLIAVGLGRLETYGAAAGVDWRSNRSWLAVVATVVIAMLVVSIPAAFVVGAPPTAILEAAWVSVGAVLGLVGTVVAVVAAPVLAGFEALVAAMPTPAPTALPTAPPSLPVGGGTIVPMEGDPRLGLTIAILALVAVAVVLVAVVARLRVRSASAARPAPTAPPSEERSIERPRIDLHLPAIRSLRPRAPAPRTAPDAYLALLDDLATDAIVARRPQESPRAHAARLLAARAGGDEPSFRTPPAESGAGSPRGGPPSSRTGPTTPEVEAERVGADWAFGHAGGRRHLADAAAAERARRAVAGAGVSGRPRPVVSDPVDRLALALLVADWELARYGNRRLTRAEDSRGVARWRRLREAIRRPR